MYKEFILLGDTIKTICKTGPVYYYPNPGNYGDSLIRYGTIKFLNDLGIDYIEQSGFSRLRKLRPVGTLIYGGGGAYSTHYNRGTTVALLSKRFKNVIVLPSTFEITDNIRNLSNVTFFRRDQYESKKNLTHSFFCHDMAFYIGSIQAEKGKGKGYFFRTDKESKGTIVLPKSNYDISNTGNESTPVYRFFDEISKYEKIYTDRLHVAIAASLMNEEVHLYSGNYFKIKAIYLSSLKANYPHTYFYDSIDFDERLIDE